MTASAERTAPIGPPEPSTPAAASPSTNAHPDPARRVAAPIGWYCAPGGCGPRSADPVRGAAAFAAAALVAGLLARRRPGRAR